MSTTDPLYNPEDRNNPDYRCKHGTFLGNPNGADYMCHWCEMGDDPYPDGEADDECDFCRAPYRYADRRVAVVPRPSDPSELVSIMAGCGKCRDSIALPTPARIERMVADGEFPGVIFASV